ncbi:hypothetical protein ACWF5H_05575 [Arthrobacter sp. NPDC055138]
MAGVEPWSRKRKAKSAKNRRRFSYAVAVIVNAALFGVVNGWPGWQSVPILTDETPQVLPIFNASLVVGFVSNVLNLVFDSEKLKILGELVTSALGAAVILRTWAVFPFDFHGSTAPWDLVTRVLLGFALAGCCISIIVQVVFLVRLSRRVSPLN